ncbi:MAG: cytochrome c oxidase assembly protein [Pseudomonadota bacterium]
MAIGMKRNGRVILPLVAIVLFMSGLVAYSPTLYRLFCDLTGYGGTVRRIDSLSISAMAAAEDTVTLRFDANVAPGLDWDFRPEKTKIDVRFGEPTMAYYIAKNNTDEAIVGQATFNILPYLAASYFFKTECFCFTEQRLEAGETARMPLVLYVDPEYRDDPNTANNRVMTLSYTFFKQDAVSPDDVVSARDLKAASRELDRTFAQGGEAVFDNNAPRR